VKSEQRIYAAFEELLRKKNFDAITIRDICNQSSTSRSGFYLHFEDKFDLVRKYQDNFIDHGMQIMQENSDLGLPEIFKNLLTYLNDQGEIIAILLSNRGSIEIQSQIKDHFRKNAQKNIFPKYNLKAGSKLEEQYLTAMISGAFFGILDEWINSGKQESPEQLIQLISNEVIPSFKKSQLI